MSSAKEQAELVFAAVAGFVARTVDPMREHTRALEQVVNEQRRTIEALEARVAQLEQRQTRKSSGAVRLYSASGK